MALGEISTDRPPIAGIDHQVTDLPGGVDKEVVDVTDLSVGAVNVKPAKPACFVKHKHPLLA